MMQLRAGELPVMHCTGDHSVWLSLADPAEPPKGERRADQDWVAAYAWRRRGCGPQLA